MLVLIEQIDHELSVRGQTSMIAMDDELTHITSVFNALSVSRNKYDALDAVHVSIYNASHASDHTIAKLITLDESSAIETRYTLAAQERALETAASNAAAAQFAYRGGQTALSAQDAAGLHPNHVGAFHAATGDYEEQSEEEIENSDIDTESEVEDNSESIVAVGAIDPCGDYECPHDYGDEDAGAESDDET